MRWDGIFLRLSELQADDQTEFNLLTILNRGQIPLKVHF